MDGSIHLREVSVKAPKNRAIGAGIGEYIANRLGGKGTIVILRGGPADNTIGSDRTEGMLNCLAIVCF